MKKEILCLWGPKVDHLGKEAHIDTEAAMVQQGVITAQERRNRLLLRRVMTDVGYKPLRSEWWHFNSAVVKRQNGTIK